VLRSGPSSTVVSSEVEVCGTSRVLESLGVASSRTFCWLSLFLFPEDLLLIDLVFGEMSLID
jgi:hypothetical protein